MSNSRQATRSRPPDAVELPPVPQRVVIDGLSPEVDAGRFPARRCLGDEVEVAAQIVVDGHDQLSGVLRFRRRGQPNWRETPLSRTSQGLDRWSGTFRADSLGYWEFQVIAWIDHFLTWRAGLRAKAAAGQDLSVSCEAGAQLFERLAADAQAAVAGRLRAIAEQLHSAANGSGDAVQVADDPETEALARKADPRANACESGIRPIEVDPVLARTGAWYEFFPRSTGGPDRHGTFETARERLRYAAGMGFDVVYLPPVHPIGRKNRKGANNSVVAQDGEPGSPWAIGSAEGGHRAIHPDLGTLQDFRTFLEDAHGLGLEVAMDLAFQCAPDHPLVAEHPEWFRHLPDGSIAYAENPPKRYEDIVPFDFECDDWRGLWNELLETTRWWVEQGITLFRVDNPHTKPLPFWEWLIASIRADHPEVIFLAEAFARPALVHGLARRGFNQSYTYFAWRNTRQEIEEYLNELTRGPGREYLRPAFWPNTPDILTEYLQFGGRPASVIRLVLAATLSATYGIYGPAFELGDVRAVRPGSEEYLDSEKYQVRNWDTSSDWSLKDTITRVNQVRHEYPALTRNDTLLFHGSNNDRVVCYTKHVPGSEELLLMVVNLDPHHRQGAFVRLDEDKLHLTFEGQFLATDLLGGGSYIWEGPENYVELDPGVTPAHIFSIRRQHRTERDFDYFF